MPNHLSPTTPQMLVDMSQYVSTHPLKITVLYSDPNHPDNHMGQVYPVGFPLLLRRELAEVVCRAAQIAQERFGWTLELLDGFRPVWAQKKMWENGDYPAHMLSKPGNGAHPRGLAIDLQPYDHAGNPVDMGTSVDHLTDDPSDNPASRSYTNFRDSGRSWAVWENRARLDYCMWSAANELKFPLWPLPQEWWDYRVPKSIYEAMLPLDIQIPLAA